MPFRTSQPPEGLNNDFWLRNSNGEERRRSKVCLHLEGQGFPNLDPRSDGKSDPFCIVELREGNSASDFERIAQTETVFNNLNPKWATNVELEFKFGNAQALRFRVYDRDEPGDDPEKQDFIGEATCTLPQILLSKRQCHALQLENHNGKWFQKTGKLIIRAEEQKPDFGDSVTLQFACSHLRNVKKPYYMLSRSANDGSFVPVRYSEVSRLPHITSRTFQFGLFCISLQNLCNGEKDRQLKLELFDFHKRGKHVLCGSFLFTLAQIEADFNKAVQSGTNRTFDPPSYDICKYRQYATNPHAGKVLLLQCSTSSSLSFLDYIGAGGVVINTVFAVDMSSTNGDPAHPTSLHYDNPNGLNEYENAVREIGSVLANYDSTQAFTAWGFSACLPPNYSPISHCFPLSGNPSGICSRIDGVVAAYRNMLKQVAPHRPCRYNSVLERVINQVREEDRRTRHGIYTILVLVTDGDFCDFQDVADSICAAAELPLSIVIVGIGPAEMPLLEKLDGDDQRLCDSMDIPASRDIVQFVPFRKHRGNPAKLSQEVLAEIPDQFLSFFRSKGILPVQNRSLSTLPSAPILSSAVEDDPAHHADYANAAYNIERERDNDTSLHGSSQNHSDSFERASSVGSYSRYQGSSADASNASLSSSSSDANPSPIYPPGMRNHFPPSMHSSNANPNANPNANMMNSYTPQQSMPLSNPVVCTPSQAWMPAMPASISGYPTYSTCGSQQYQASAAMSTYPNAAITNSIIQPVSPAFSRNQSSYSHPAIYNSHQAGQFLPSQNGSRKPAESELEFSAEPLANSVMSSFPQQNTPLPSPPACDVPPSSCGDSAGLTQSTFQSFSAHQPSGFEQYAPYPSASLPAPPSLQMPQPPPALPFDSSACPQTSVPTTSYVATNSAPYAMHHYTQYSGQHMHGTPPQFHQ